MAPLAVDPAAVSGAGAAVISAGDGLAAAIGPLTSGFGANTGQDAAGEVFGLAYQDAGKNLSKAAAAGINACRTAGFKVEVCASNYSRAEAASTIGGGGAVLPTPTQPGNFDAPGAPWTLGPGTPEPALWVVVEAFVGDLWPNGNPGQMHTAAGCWRTFGAALHGVKAAMQGPNSVIGAQQMPEGGVIQQAFSKIGDDIAKIGDECNNLAKGLDDFANEVQHAQDSIRDLLHRLATPGGLWHELTAVFNGHGLDEIKRIANDIRAVLHNMKREADAREQLFQKAKSWLDDATVSLEHWVDKECAHFLGQDVGAVPAFLIDRYLDIEEGGIGAAADFVHGVAQLDPVRFAYDPKGALSSWQDFAKLPLMVANPAEIPMMIAADPKGMLDTVKGLTDYKDWTSDRPLVAFGHNLFDVGTAVIPGLGEAGAAAKGAEAAGAAARAADAAGEADAAAGAIGRDGRALGDAGELASVTKSLDNIGKTTDGLANDLNKVSGDLPKGDTSAPPGGRPNALPPPKPGDAPVNPTSPPVESAPAPPADPPGAAPPPHAPEGAAPPPPAEQPVPATAAPGGHAPSTAPQLSEPAPAHAQLPPYGTPTDPAAPVAESPTAPSSPAPAPPTPHASPPADFPPAAADSPTPPPSGTGPSHAWSQPASPHDAAPSGPGDEGSFHQSGPPADNPIHEHGEPPADGPPRELSVEKRDEILAMEKGTRPDPSEYLPRDYIEHHLDQFHDGASRFMPESNFDKYGIAQRDGTSFVMPKREADALIDSTHGDPRALEKALGLPEGFLDSRNVVRIDINHPEEFNLRMPSGNEAGANDQWIPGGLLPDGASEAIVDGGKIPRSDYSVSEVPK